MGAPTPKISEEAVEVLARSRYERGRIRALDRRFGDLLPGNQRGLLDWARRDLEVAYPALRSSLLEEMRRELRPELDSLREEAAACRDQAIRHKDGRDRNALLGRGQTFDGFADRLEAALSSLASEGGER